MRFSITGGSDVTGSAERAPFGLDQFDRLAVGVITVANSPERATENRDAVTGVVFAAGKADKPYCAASPLSGGPVPFLSPDPRTLAGADGRRSTPSLLAVGAKSDGVAASSSVGASSERNVGVHESRQAVPYSPWAVRRPSNSLRSTYP